MRISTRHIALFAAIAKQGNVSKAAETLNLTQAAASMALAEFEQQLGISLFDRQGKKLLLNHAGDMLLPKAMQIIQDLQEFQDLAKSSTLMAGELNIGASTTIANYLLPKIISQFVRQYPEVKINLQVGNSKQIVNAMKHYQIDIGFIEGICQVQELKITPWQQDELIYVVNPSHPLAHQAEISLTELSKAQWILRELGSGTRQIFERAIYQKLKSLNILLELGSAEAIKQALMNSEAIGCLSALTLQTELANQTLVKLHVPSLFMQRELNLLMHSAKSESSLVQAFKNFASHQGFEKPRIKVRAVVN